MKIVKILKNSIFLILYEQKQNLHNNYRFVIYQCYFDLLSLDELYCAGLTKNEKNSNKKCIKICTFGQLAEYGPERLVNGLHPISYRRAIPPTDWALCAGLHWQVCFRPNSPWTSVDVTQLNIPPNKKRIM